MENISQLLDQLGIKYAIGGAIAQNFWGTVRATQDVDILIAIPRIRFQELAEALGKSGCHMLDSLGGAIPVSVEAILAQERDQHFFAIYHGLVKVEIFLPFIPLQHSILKRAVIMPLGNRKVPITTAEDLILLKMAYHREKDMLDIRSMIWNQQGKLDLLYLRGEAATMLSEERIQELENWIARYSRDGTATPE